MNKSELLNIIRIKLSEKIKTFENLISETRAANNETKSSMGDKYETSREMVQQEINNLQRQLNESLAQENAIKKLDSEICSEVKLGALVETNVGVFYIATSVGEISHEGKKIRTVSMESPIAKTMSGKKKNDVFIINSISQTIKNIW
ncbi:MAG: hypothetical protein L6264_11240 [Weeksellaceae bacterium]|nr:hypothetical protein [Bacteroidota bacterium]MCG2781511.1 hypothetical protein [Weeksellaceae bacterium]